MSKQSIVITPRGYGRHGADYEKILNNKGYATFVNRTGEQLTRTEFLELAKNASGIIFGVEKMDTELFEVAPNLKAIVKFGVGLDNVDLTAAQNHNIKVGRTIGSNSNAVAETALTLILMSSKKIVESVLAVRDGKWIKPSGLELKGKKVGIIGFGDIGQRVAELCTVFNTEILVHDFYPIKEELINSLNLKVASKEEIYEQCDFITLHLPLTDDTKNMISTKELELMKKTAVLVNTARGGIVDERALYSALKNNSIFSAAFDVFTSEPPKTDPWIQELIQLDNFILTSHIAARTKEAEINSIKMATDKLIELLEEE